MPNEPCFVVVVLWLIVFIGTRLEGGRAVNNRIARTALMVVCCGGDVTVANPVVLGVAAATAGCSYLIHGLIRFNLPIINTYTR